MIKKINHLNLLKNKNHIYKKKITSKKKKKKVWRKATWVKVQLYMGIFIQKWCPIFPFSFLSILEKKLFSRPRKKTPRSHHLFFFLPTQPNTLQKSFPSYFLFKILHPPYKFICMWVFLILLVCITFCYNTICVNTDMIGCLCTI